MDTKTFARMSIKEREEWCDTHPVERWPDDVTVANYEVEFEQKRYEYEELFKSHHGSYINEPRHSEPISIPQYYNEDGEVVVNKYFDVLKNKYCILDKGDEIVICNAKPYKDEKKGCWMSSSTTPNKFVSKETFNSWNLKLTWNLEKLKSGRKELKYCYVDMNVIDNLL